MQNPAQQFNGVVVLPLPKYEAPALIFKDYGKPFISDDMGLDFVCYVPKYRTLKKSPLLKQLKKPFYNRLPEIVENAYPLIAQIIEDGLYTVDVGLPDGCEEYRVDRIAECKHNGQKIPHYRYLREVLGPDSLKLYFENSGSKSEEQKRCDDLIIKYYIELKGKGKTERRKWQNDIVTKLKKKHEIKCDERTIRNLINQQLKLTKEFLEPFEKQQEQAHPRIPLRIFTPIGKII